MQPKRKKITLHYVIIRFVAFQFYFDKYNDFDKPKVLLKIVYLQLYTNN